jgi:hypothetical protein
MNVILTGILTVLIPAPASWLTSSCVNHVDQCLSKMPSTVFGYAFAKLLEQMTLKFVAESHVSLQFGTNARRAIAIDLASHVDPFYQGIQCVNELALD